MLNFLRKSVGSWVGMGILALALGALVITLFQPTGPTGTTSRDVVLATVGGRTVREAEFINIVNRAVQQERAANPEMTLPQFIAAGGGELVLDQMIGTEVLAEYGQRHGVIVSKRMIDGEIASIPALQVNGRFDENMFRNMLAQQQMSETELRDSIARELQGRQLLQPIAQGLTVPRGMAEPYAALLLEVRRGSILPVPSAAMADPGKPTDAQLAAFHKENVRAYTIPERRAFRFVEIDRNMVAERAKPTQAEVEAYYKSNPGEFGGLERREINQIVLRSDAAARAFVAAVRKGTSFADAAAKEGFSASDIALGEQTQTSLAETTGKSVAETAFRLEQGAVSEPVQSALGWHVLQVARIVPAKQQPLAAVAAGIERQLQEQKAQDQLAEIIADAENRLAAGESLVDVAKAIGSAVQTAPAMTADGRIFDEKFAVTQVEQPLLAAVFRADQADGAQAAEVEPGRFVLLEVSDIIPPTVVPMDKIRDDVAVAWGIRMRSDAARREADRIVAAVAKGQKLPQAIGEARLPKPQPISVRRLELSQMVQQGQQVPPPVTAMLAMPQGKARVVPAPAGQGWFVVLVDSVEPGDLSQMPQLVEAVRQSMRSDAINELADSFIRKAQSEAGVVRKQAEIAAAKQRLTGAIEAADQ